MRGQRNQGSLAARYSSSRPLNNRLSNLSSSNNDAGLSFQFSQLKKQMFDIFRELDKYPRYNRQIGDEKKDFYQHLYLIQNSCLNHILVHSEIIKILQQIMETLEQLNEIFKSLRKLKGSDLSLGFVKSIDSFDEFYKHWDTLLDKQLKLGLNKINIDPEDKLQQLKEVLQDYLFMHLVLQNMNEGSLMYIIQIALNFDEVYMGKVNTIFNQLRQKVDVQQSIVLSNMTLDEVNETFMSYREESEEVSSNSRNQRSGIDTSSPEKSSQNSYQSVGSFHNKTPAEQLALILMGDFKCGGSRTPRRNSKYGDSDFWKKKHSKSEDKKQKKIERQEDKEEAKFVVTMRSKDSNPKGHDKQDFSDIKEDEVNDEENDPFDSAADLKPTVKYVNEEELNHQPRLNHQTSMDLESFQGSFNIQNDAQATVISKKKKVKINTEAPQQFDYEDNINDYGATKDDPDDHHYEDRIQGKSNFESLQSNMRHSSKVKSAIEHSKAKPKILKVQVIDIKSEVPSAFEISQNIAEITSDQAEKRPIVFGRGENADVRFSEDNIYIAEHQFKIEYNRPHFSLIDVGSEYPTLIRLEQNKKVLLSRYDYISLSEQSDFYVMDLVTDDQNAQILNDSLELRYFDAKNEPKVSNKKSITLKFHDGALAGNKFVLEQKRTTIGRSNNRDLIIPSTATTVSKLHSTILYERGYWYLQDHSTYGTFMYPRTVVEMKNHKPSSRIKVHNNMKVSVGAISFLENIQGASYNVCPTMGCDADIGEKVCYLHSASNPVTYIRMYQCPQNYICDISDSSKYAWVDSKYQQYTSSSNPLRSQVYGSMTVGKCKKASILDANLNNGRECIKDNQCISQRCVKGYCKGRDENDNCAQHSDCDAQLVCLQDQSWPYASKCRPWGTNDTLCLSDYECSPFHFCWFKNQSEATSGTKRCLQMHSKPLTHKFGWKFVDTEDDFINSLYNGQYCISGLAVQTGLYEGMCTQIIRINSDRGDVQAPYPCTVTNPATVCKYFYDATNYLEKECQCGFNGSTGYCPYPSQTEFNKYLIYKVKVLNSSQCHTLDRIDYRAQSEECGIGPIEDLKIAIALDFNFTMWPFIQNKNSYTCLNHIHPLSSQNLLKSNANIFQAALGIIIISVFSFLFA
ncbi:UNKNOWN [Stylonychia lemnae]|uniref:FHA domain-containing protein n=1 Tax=Stylonychia lemnae TaxID=5949 RepID=A0A077ZR77_STYLE|nr:UNKNOWN [Stylonychia lemnae]|eukprot:CDW72418.1 UNKNOWN [Stylonychia lemnae]